MRPTDLPVAVKNSGVVLEDLVPLVLRRAPHPKLYLRVSHLYRRMAVGMLLMSGDSRVFFGYLFKAGRAFADFCSRANAGDLLGSAFLPVLDAIVCRDEPGVRTIAAHLPAAPNPSREYEEDFYYLRILVSMYLDRRPGPDAHQWLQEYEKLVASSGQDDYRLEVCRSLVSGVQAEIEQALIGAAERVQGDAQRRYEEESWEMDDGNLLSRVSIEVLAWIEIAARMGIATGPLPMAPVAARPAGAVPLPAPDAWRIPESFKTFD